MVTVPLPKVCTLHLSHAVDRVTPQHVVCGDCGVTLGRVCPRCMGVDPVVPVHYSPDDFRECTTCGGWGWVGFPK